MQSVRTIATCDHHVDQHNQYVGQLCCSSTAQVLSKITLDLRAGKTTAVVGKSGCGKSTLSASATLWSTYVDMRCTEKSQRLEIKKKRQEILEMKIRMKKSIEMSDPTEIYAYSVYSKNLRDCFGMLQYSHVFF